MSTAAQQSDGNTPAPWHAAYPAPRNAQPGTVTRDELLKMLKSGETVAGRDFLLVDVRRQDHEGGTIRGSINLPAQSLYPTIPTLYNLIKAAGVRKVIWYCGSSAGRGTRAAGWFADHIIDRDEGHVLESLIMSGGIKGWVKAGGEFVEYMDEYDEACWASK